ncbi:HAD family hydrolase [Glutamicibacter arilaitensis]|nr:hypothetical protein [Glutamicibacter arilaitensis]
MNVTLAFITNNAGRSPMSVAAHLRQLGVKTSAEQVFARLMPARRCWPAN